MVSPVTIKPGFGRRTETPKTLTVKNSASGGKNVTASSGSLKSYATQTVSTATLSNECRTRAASTQSNNFVPGEKPIEFTRDRTQTLAYGEVQSNDSEIRDTHMRGMTNRSMERLLKKHAQLEQDQQRAMLSQLNSMYGNNNVQQAKTSWSDVITLVTTGISSLIGGLSSEKGGKTDAAKTVVSSDPTLAAMQNAKTSDELTTAIGNATGQLNNVKSSISDGQAVLKDLQGKSSGLKTASDNATAAVQENATAISQKQGEVQNNINRESASQMAMNAAQSQVDMLKSQLSSAGPAAKAGIEASLRQAEEQLKLKTDQYNQAVEAREQSQADLQNLQSQTEGLKNDEKTAKAAYEDNQQQIGAKQKEVSTLENQQKELTSGIETANQRLAELQKKDGDDE